MTPHLENENEDANAAETGNAKMKIVSDNDLVESVDRRPSY